MFKKTIEKIKNIFRKEEEEEVGHLLNGSWLPTPEQIRNAKRIDGLGPEDDIFVQLGLVELDAPKKLVNWIDSSELPDLPLAAKYEIADLNWSLHYKKDGGFVLYTNPTHTKHFILNESGKPITLEQDGNLDEDFNAIFFNDIKKPIENFTMDGDFKCCGKGCSDHSKFSELLEYNNKKTAAGISVLKMIEAYNA